MKLFTSNPHKQELLKMTLNSEGFALLPKQLNVNFVKNLTLLYFEVNLSMKIDTY
jgi:hypothetical protein